MWFDARAKLAEIAEQPPATSATPATIAPAARPVSQVSQVSQHPKPKEKMHGGFWGKAHIANVARVTTPGAPKINSETHWPSMAFAYTVDDKMGVAMINQLWNSGVAALLGLLVSSTEVRSQDFDPFSADGTFFTVAQSAMLWLGAHNGIVQQCQGDISEDLNRLIEFYDKLTLIYNKDYASAMAGFFGEGTLIGEAVGCDIDKARVYRGWAYLYLDAAISRLNP